VHWKITSLWGEKKVELREPPRAVTPFGGLVVFFEFLRQVGYCEAVKQHLPFRLTSHNAIDPVETFTVFVKGAGFSSMRNTPRARKGRIGIGQWEKRMEGKKTRTLEQHKGAAPEVQKHSEAGAPGIRLLEEGQKFLDGHSGMTDQGTKSAHG